MTLLGLLNENKEAKRIFGPGEIRTMKKQLMGVKLTQSEKNRLSRSIRPKLNFIRKAALFRDEFDVKKGGEVLKQLEILKGTLLNDKLGRKITRIHLFGSFTENEMSMGSDVDVAIEFDNITKREASLFKKRIIPQIGSLFDLSVFNILPQNIKQEITKHGRVFRSFE